MKPLVLPALLLSLLGACAPEAPVSRPVFVAFVRDDCPPCALMEPWLEALRRAHAADLDVAIVNVDRQGGAELSDYFGIVAIPSQVVINAADRVVDTHAGVASGADMEAMLAECFARSGGH